MKTQNLQEILNQNYMLDFLSIGYRVFFSLYIKQILHYLNYFSNYLDKW